MVRRITNKNNRERKNHLIEVIDGKKLFKGKYIEWGDYLEVTLNNGEKIKGWTATRNPDRNRKFVIGDNQDSFGPRINVYPYEVKNIKLLKTFR